VVDSSRSLGAAAGIIIFGTVGSILGAAGASWATGN